VAAVISLTVSIASGIVLGKMDAFILPSFNPSYWWNEMWGIGFGLEFMTFLKTIPFAFFVLFLWAIDTISITTMLDSNYQHDEKKEEINLERSFIITSFRNILGGIFGGAQTSALWRSFLIPLFMMKRPLRPASILLGILGIAAGFTAYPIMVLSFPPLIWSVLLFGIFLPFVVVGFRNFRSTKKWMDKTVILVATVFGILISPMLTWVGAILFETIDKVIQRNNKHE
jgi:hypothetical protein